MTRTIRDFDGRELTGNGSLGVVYVYDNGQARVTFDGGGRDWFVWHVARQQRLATYRTRRELERDYRASNNSDGAYGCAELHLGDE